MDQSSSPSQYHLQDSTEKILGSMLRNKARDKPNRPVASTSSAVNEFVDASVPDTSTALPANCTQSAVSSSVTTTANSTAALLSASGRSRKSNVTEASERSRLLLTSLNSMGLTNQLTAFGTLLDLPGSMRLLHPLFQNISDFGYEFDSDGILRNVQTGESLSMKVTFTGAALKRQEMIRAICTRQVRQRLFDLNMESSQIPIPGHPTLCMRVLHSVNLFTHRGPVLVVLQAGGVAQAGVWANRLLLHPQHGLRTGSQLELIRKAHERGFAVALINANEHVPSEAEMDAMELISNLLPTVSDKMDRGRPCDTPTEDQDTGVRPATGTFRVPGPRLVSTTGGAHRPESTSVPNPSGCEISDGTIIDAIKTERSETLVNKSTSYNKSESPVSQPILSTCPDNASSLSNSALYTLLLLNSTVGSRLDPSVSGTSHAPMSSSTHCEVNESVDNNISTVPSCSSVRFIRPGIPSTSTHFRSGNLNVLEKLSASVTPQINKEPSFAVPAPVKPAPQNKYSGINNSPLSVVPHSGTSYTETTSTRDTFLTAKIQTDNGLSQPPDLTAPVQPESTSVNGARPSSWSSTNRCAPPPTTLEQSLDVSSEDRLYGIWRQLIPHLASDQIVIWAHQQGGYALLHPLTPMPGLWPGFPDEHQHHQQLIDREPSAAQVAVTRSISVRETESVVCPTSMYTVDQCSAASFQPSKPSISTSNMPTNQVDSLKNSSMSNSLLSMDQPPSNSIPLATTGEHDLHDRPKAYATRKRHMSANAILSTCPIPVTSVAQYPVAHHRSLTPLNEHSREAIEMMKMEVHQKPGSTCSSLTGSSVTLTEPSEAPLISADQVRSKGSSSRPWLDRRVYGPWCYHVSPDAARRVFQTSEDTNYSGVEGDTSCIPANSTESPIQLGSTLPSLSGDPFDTEMSTKRGGVVSRNLGVWASGDRESSEFATADDKTVRLRLARAWQRKARRLQAELAARVKSIVFTDCPTALDLAMEGVGWGLMLLQDPQPATVNSGPRLFQPSILQSQLPERVIEARKWFADHSIHYVAADSPIGTRLDEGACRAHQIPVLSAGTTEHDLIPSSVLNAVFDLFELKLNPLGRRDSTMSDVNTSSSRASTSVPNTAENSNHTTGTSSVNDRNCDSS